MNAPFFSSSTLPSIGRNRAHIRASRRAAAAVAVLAVIGAIGTLVAIWLTTASAVLVLACALAIATGVAAYYFDRSRTLSDPLAALPQTDWSMLRSLASGDPTPVAVTDRWGRMTCANDAYADLFGGFVRPLDLDFDHGGTEELEAAAGQVIRDGNAQHLRLRMREREVDVTLSRGGEAESHLVYRFVPVDHVDAIDQIHALLSGKGAQILGQAGIMAALVGRDGRVRASTRSFAIRAIADPDIDISGSEFTSFLRVDERGMIFFSREEEGATPLRILQMPLDADDERGPMLVALLDEDGGAIERGVALNYIESLLAMLPFGLAMVDRDGRFLYLNKGFAAMAGVSATRPPAYPGDIVVKEDKAALGEAIRRYATGQQLTGDLGVRLASQPEDIVVMSIAGVRGLGEAAVLLSFKDTSEETRLKRQVAQATKMQAVGQLAGGVAHDFNNILTAIIGYCDLMLMRHSPGSSDYDDIQQIRSNSNRAANLTRQLLAFSRQQTLRPQVLQLADVVSDVTTLLARLMDEKVKLTVRHGRGLGSVRADPGQLEQVIVNLAVNARDAMLEAEDSSGELMIETYAVTAREVPALDRDIMPAADYSVLRITDTGAGISPENIAKIFEPFFTTKEIGKGTGLGLSTVYGIIKQSNGYIFADSVVGKGTRFTIYLPVHSRPVPQVQPMSSEAAASEPPKPQGEWGTGNILLVEDEKMVRAVAERALERAGYTVTTASDGEDAIEKLKSMKNGANLIITDVVMPRMDGPTLAAHIREENPDMPILFMSGYAEEQLRKSIALDNVGFLPKPFSVAQITEAAARYLNAS